MVVPEGHQMITLHMITTVYVVFSVSDTSWLITYQKKPTTTEYYVTTNY